MVTFIAPIKLPQPSGRTLLLAKGPTCSVSSPQTTERDSIAIRRCVDLARKAAGQTRPNPPVGCVIQDSTGKLLGEGYHPRAGKPHAEPHALADAAAKGNSVRGATVYVSLEPCNHYGRTPPCSQALVEAKVGRVVVGMVDPNPKVAGQGLNTLRNAGIEVVGGVEEELCQELVEGFVHRMKKKRPMGILKYAMSLDGKIATDSGSSKWVTGESSRRRVHEIRAQMDAIVVGGETMRKDDPRLTVRDATDKESERLLSPIRVVMSKSMQLPRTARMWETAHMYDTVVLTGTDHGEDSFVRELRGKGVTVEQIPGLSPDDVMAFLYEKDCLNVLWECGGRLAAQAVRDGAVQKVHAFVAPKLVGGEHAPTPLGAPPLIADMADAPRLQRTRVESFDGGDLLVTGYLE